jgi:hypothetical protein
MSIYGATYTLYTLRSIDFGISTPSYEQRKVRLIAIRLELQTLKARFFACFSTQVMNYQDVMLLFNYSCQFKFNMAMIMLCN